MKLLKYIIDKKTWLMGKINNPIHCHGFFMYIAILLYEHPWSPIVISLRK